MQETVLELKNYSVSFDTPDGEVQAVRNVDLTVKKGEILCIVGESGCGKTVMCRSVMKLLPPNAHVKSGEISLCGENITAYKRKKMEKLCGSKVSMVFQDPMLTLNPTIPVGKQITEAIIKNQKVSGDEAKKRAVEMLKLVGIPDAEQRYGLQPHFFSGGMRQRCVLAIALACDPEILFADEATTALDATVEAKILDLLLELREKTGISIVFISFPFFQSSFLIFQCWFHNCYLTSICSLLGIFKGYCTFSCSCYRNRTIFFYLGNLCI